MIFHDMSLGMFRKGFRIDMGRYENILLRTFAVKYGWRMKEKEKRECRREERGEERRQASISRRQDSSTKQIKDGRKQKEADTNQKNRKNRQKKTEEKMGLKTKIK